MRNIERFSMRHLTLHLIHRQNLSLGWIEAPRFEQSYIPRSRYRLV
jgi:hypothetical protein